ncbi:MAG: SDR family NAD(P)-dependent oxidoreductase [Verrucomicrobiae bacterium]|nr:SDR family NAD(P)-dependent oxidoreductase [Verrucomicrobiae bacterium]
MAAAGDTPEASELRQRRLVGRIALVTGASRGLGRAIAVALASEGAHVVISARTVGALEEVDDEIGRAGGKATILPLDMKRLDKVDQLGPALYERWGKLDVLIGNAGTLGNLTPIAHVTDDVWDYTLNLNLGANFRLIRTLDPLLQRSGAGRAVFVTSGAARKSTAYWGPYAVSKAALESLVKTYAAEIATTSVQACLFNPGPVRTAMRAKVFPGEDAGLLPAPEDIAPLVVALALPSSDVNGRTFDAPAQRSAAVSDVPASAGSG